MTYTFKEGNTEYIIVKGEEEDENREDVINEDTLKKELMGKSLMDANMFSDALTFYPDLAPFIISVVMKGEKEKIKEIIAEHTITNLKHKSVRLDSLISLKDGTKIDLEMSRCRIGIRKLFKRTRKYRSEIEHMSLSEGEDYDKMPDVVIIFLLEHDLFKSGKAQYVCSMHDEETREKAEDFGELIIYHNLSYDGLDEMGDFNRDFRSANPERMKCGIIKETMEGIQKEMEGEEVNKYVNAINKSRAEAFTEAFAEGGNKKLTEIVTNMILNGNHFADIAKLCGCSISFVEDVAKTI